MQKKITPFLWFDDNAEEAANFYVSIFKNSKVLGVSHYGKDGPGDDGTVMTVSFVLDGEEFIGLNGGPTYKFTEAVSFFVGCDTQEEIDELWEKLSEGGEKRECGWLKDKFGVSWQIVPSLVTKLLAESDQARLDRVTKEVWQMQKLDLKVLEKAYRGASPGK
jgi:predicted 3-demethylubiquinone-9 3-methyltransferase (glyoxalase superfamily)